MIFRLEYILKVASGIIRIRHTVLIAMIAGPNVDGLTKFET